MPKTASFALVHFSVAFGVTWLLTGSIALGGLVALIEPAINTVAYHVHEKAWTRYGDRRARRALAA
jgi:uncharacterized membrane protein